MNARLVYFMILLPITSCSLFWNEVEGVSQKIIHDPEVRVDTEKLAVDVYKDVF